MQHRFPHGLAGNGAGVDARPADHLPLLDQRDVFAGFGGLNGGPLARRAGADDDQVVALHAD